MSTPPDFEDITQDQTSDLVELVRREYGLDVTLGRVGGESAWNFIVTAADRRLFMKCSEVSASGADDIEVVLQDHILATMPGAPVAAPLRTRDGSLSVLWKNRIVWLTTFKDGRPVDPDAATPRLRESIGAAMATVDLALSSAVVSPAPETSWDLQRADEVIENLRGARPITDAGLLCDVLSTFASEVLPRLDEMPRQLIHNDINPSNVMISGEHPVAIIDFGDATVAPIVQELGTALAYLSSGRTVDALIESMADVASGYLRAGVMDPEWIQLLPSVVRARCAFALGKTRLLAATLARGDHRQYVLRNEARTARRVAMLLSSPADVQGSQLLAALADRVRGATWRRR